MNPARWPGYFRDTAFRFLPHRARTGLIRIGHPGPDAPVLVTGNFTLTVRRLRAALSGRDAWLLVADSKGINVWCAASGGHLTHHDIISAIRVSGLAARVSSREIILPQLCATGVEHAPITEATGFETRWGPARLEDLPGFLARGRRVRNAERRMRFPLRERLEMATMWTVPTLLIVLPLLALTAGAVAAVAGGLALAAEVFAIFAALPRLNVQGRARYATFAATWLATALIAALALAAFAVPLPTIALTAGVGLVGVALLAVDLAGTTPWYPSYVNIAADPAEIELVADRCTGASDCVQVCPAEVLKMKGGARKVALVRPEACLRCGACIVQCPEGALRFRYADGSVVEARTIRKTRMNMLGKRRVMASLTEGRARDNAGRAMRPPAGDEG